ncbi:MAG: hypothetical protein ABJB09_02835 [Verrucomicrobiota bacterium]
MKTQMKLAVIIILGLAAVSRAGDAMLPDPKLTPGRLARVGSPHHELGEALEREVFKRYRIPWSRRAEFRIDRLIPVELGGADSIDNLWPQSFKVKPYDVERKELLTRRLLALIHSGRITLAQAQEEVSKDWIDAFIDHVGFVYLR